MNRVAILFCLIVAGLLCGVMVKAYAKRPMHYGSKEFYIKSAAIVRPTQKE